MYIEELNQSLTQLAKLCQCKVQVVEKDPNSLHVICERCEFGTCTAMVHCSPRYITVALGCSSYAVKNVRVASRSREEI